MTSPQCLSLAKAENENGQAQYSDRGQNSEVDKTHVPLFSCFQMTLHHTEIREESDNDFSDQATFVAVRSTYIKSLGRLGNWNNRLNLRSLKRILILKVLN